MKERLMLFISRENISATTLADEIGVQRSSISHILSGRNNPSYDFIHKLITRYENLNLEWLITGKGDMYKPDQELMNQPQGMIQEITRQQISVTENSGCYERATRSEIKAGGASGTNKKDKVTNVNKIEKIVYFFQNGTFKEYNPAE